MGTIRTSLLTLCIMALICGCAAQQNLVVLLPDPNGKTGPIEVSNQGGAQVITEANSAAEVKSFTTAPASLAKMNESQIRAIFGDALDAQPHPPEHYLLYFEGYSAELTEDSLLNLEDVFDAIERIRPAEVTVVGHTDRVGSRENNYFLGLERASQIKKLLISKGVDESLIEIKSHGEDNPLFKTDDDVPEPENRRVEIIIR
jgi:outer membrane protein OmpA-like peptidoglycan-associated protein